MISQQTEEKPQKIEARVAILETELADTSYLMEAQRSHINNSENLTLV